MAALSDSILPIESLREEFEREYLSRRVVVSAPTGSGKSTQVPRWCGVKGRVLVVEPRRVACRGLASWVARLEKTPLGEGVGYLVRGDRRASDESQIVFATPGIVLRMLESGNLEGFATVILDEFHERSLDVDLLLALLLSRYQGNMVVMSATLAGDKVAKHIGGKHLEGKGRLYPVEKHYIPGRLNVPDMRGIDERLELALKKARSLEGDILVFLPGKGEIAKAHQVARAFSEFEVLELHGGLSLKEQSRVFDPGLRRRIILSTNVAETSLTVPRISVVVDSGLVRQTRYHNDQGYLTLVAVAQDSADQRAGRAGRLGPGVCYRLWSDAGRLAPHTSPEIYREALEPLLLATLACGADIEKLPFIDPPKEHAVDTASRYLASLQAMDDEGRITSVGRKLFGLPLDTSQGRLLVEAEKQGCISAFIDLVAVLSVGRQLFTRPLLEKDESDPRYAGCDATAIVRAMNGVEGSSPAISTYVYGEAKRIRRRLRGLWGLGEHEASPVPSIRELAEVALRADARCVYMARRRKGRVSWSAGGTEIELDRNSSVNEKEVDCIAVLETHAIGMDLRKTVLVATCAIPLKMKWLASEGIGEDELGDVFVEKNTLVAMIDRVHAGKVLVSRREIPEGELAERALLKLLLASRLYPKALAESRERHANARLWHGLSGLGLLEDGRVWEEIPVDTRYDGGFEDWLRDRVRLMGLESGRDLALLDGGDFLFPLLPESAVDWLGRRYPLSFSAEQDKYQVHFDLEKRRVRVEHIAGRGKDPPTDFFLPAYPGFRVVMEHRGRMLTLRA